jgi:hypothetical protein
MKRIKGDLTSIPRLTRAERKAANFSDRCDAKCPDLPKVL